MTIALYAEQPFSLVILTVSSIHPHISPPQSPAYTRAFYFRQTLIPITTCGEQSDHFGIQVQYLAREAVHDKSLHVVVDGERPALGVLVGLDARDQLRRAALHNRPALSRRVTPADSLGRSPLGTIPMRAPTNAPSASAWWSQNPRPRNQRQPIAEHPRGSGRLQR